MFKDIEEAVKILRSGGIILYPTDTVWGIGCDATREEAVSKIHRIKKSNEDKSMLVLFNNINLIDRYVSIVPEIAYELIEVSVNPLTIIYPGARNLAKNIIAHDGSVGIRIVNDGFCGELINKFKKPVVSTSANFSGDITAGSFSKIPQEIINSVDYVVKWGQNFGGNTKPSEIIKLGIHGEIQIIRKN